MVYCLWALITMFRTSVTRVKIGMIFFSDECIRISLGMDSIKKKKKKHRQILLELWESVSVIHQI